MDLTIELVPQTLWFDNLRSILSPEKWDKLRKDTYRRVGYRCEICGGKGDNWPVECHEKWQYDDENHIAKLVGLYGLCPSCHEVKHIGLAAVRKRLGAAISHFCKVNGINEHQAEILIRDAFDVWEQRSRHEWTLDITWINELDF